MTITPFRMHPGCQNRGIGTQLLRAMETHFGAVQRDELFTSERSTRNLYQYQKLGYHNAENMTAIVTHAHECGASYILASFGMTLRDRQRAYYYTQPDRLFPGLRKQYEQRFGARYFAAANDAHRLKQIFHEQCDRYGIATRMSVYEADAPFQPALL